MTNEEAEAITMLKRMQEPEAWEPQITEKAFEALDMGISALKKMIPEMPKCIITNKEVAGNFQMVCPSCGLLMFERVTTKDKSEPVVYRICNFCQSCGQRIDWGKS